LRALIAAEEELTKRLIELEAAEVSLTAALSLSETANDNDIARLTAVYENMKSADAARLFEEMAPDFAAGFLVRMRPDVAAAIMAGLDPPTAYSISAIIAGRNANAPTQ
jgi:flagellar motility protein MotE (MotC chaperone)